MIRLVGRVWVGAGIARRPPLGVTRSFDPEAPGTEQGGRADRGVAEPVPNRIDRA
jgi:hypothetical protein